MTDCEKIQVTKGKGLHAANGTSNLTNDLLLLLMIVWEVVGVNLIPMIITRPPYFHSNNFTPLTKLSKIFESLERKRTKIRYFLTFSNY